MTDDRSPVIRALVTRMRATAQQNKDRVDVCDCLWSAAAVLELIDHQQRCLFQLLSSPPRILRYDMPPDAVLEPGKPVARG